MTLDPTLDTLAHALADQGIGAHEPEIAAAARRFSTRLPRSHILLAVLLDRGASAVARERAFGQLLVEYARLDQTGLLDPPAALVA